MRNIDDCRSNIAQRGVIDSDEEIDIDMEANQAINRELKEEQLRLRKAAAAEAAPLYTTKKKSDHYASEIVKAIIRLKNPAYASQLLTWKELKALRKFTNVVSNFICLSNNELH